MRTDLIKALMHTHQGQIRAFLRRLCKEHALADDLAQDTFIRAYRKLGQIGEAHTHKAWLYKIAYRLFLDHIRKQDRRTDLAQQYLEVETQSDPVPSGVKMDVHEAMNSLPAEQRACVMLCLSYGFSNSEAAEALNLPLGTVKSHIRRGKTTLRAFLSAYEKA